MVAVKSMPPMGGGAPMGPPMGGQMGPPPAAPAQMPNMGMAPPPQAGIPQAAQGANQLSTQVSGYGGSASGRANFKNSLRKRKSNFMQKQQQQMPPPMAVPPMGAPMQPPASFGQMGGMPMGAPKPPMGPMSPMGPMGPVPPMGGNPQIGRMIGDNASVGSAPVQMMDGGVVSLFNGLGRY